MAENMELVVNEFDVPNQIDFNYEELKKELTVRVEKYKGIVYTEETIKDAKADRALLNKVSKAINDAKKRQKEKLLEPYLDFENRCKELMAIVDNVTAEIDVQIKAYEQSEKDDKKVEILTYWSENSKEYGELIDTEKLIKEQWLNKSYSMTKVKQEIDHIVNTIPADFKVLETTFPDDEKICNLAKDYYINNIDNPSRLGQAIAEGNRFKEQSNKIENVEKKAEIKPTAETASAEEDEITIDFRVTATKEKMKLLKEFLVTNKYKIGVVK